MFTSLISLQHIRTLFFHFQYSLVHFQIQNQIHLLSSWQCLFQIFAQLEPFQPLLFYFFQFLFHWSDLSVHSTRTSIYLSSLSAATVSSSSVLTLSFLCFFPMSLSAPMFTSPISSFCWFLLKLGLLKM